MIGSELLLLHLFEITVYFVIDIELDDLNPKTFASSMMQNYLALAL
jgi:hypothetical protein